MRRGKAPAARVIRRRDPVGLLLDELVVHLMDTAKSTIDERVHAMASAAMTIIKLRRVLHVRRGYRKFWRKKKRGSA